MRKRSLNDSMLWALGKSKKLMGRLPELDWHIALLFVSVIRTRYTYSRMVERVIRAPFSMLMYIYLGSK